MKKLILVPAIVFSVALFTSCTITTSPSVPATGYTEYNTGYRGYTVNYTYGAGNDDIGDGTYIGYGGWASTFYAPGYRYGYRGYSAR